MASTLALHGAVDADLFADTQGEALFIRAKFAEMSEAATGNPFMPQTLKLIQSKDSIKAKYEATLKGLNARRAAMAGKQLTS